MKLRPARAGAAPFLLISFWASLAFTDCLLTASSPALGQIQTVPAPSRRRPSFNPYADSSLPVDVYRQRRYHHSGTIGRMGLGADPYHPEGPGNVVTPGR